MTLEELEEKVKDLKAKVEAMKNVTQDRLHKLSLHDAIFELCMGWGQKKGWLKIRREFVLGNIICCAREPKEFRSWATRVTINGVSVYECIHGEYYARLFKDGKWADSISNAWREKKTMIHIERLTKQIADWSPMEEK